jgi:hypothetical protein
VYAVLPIRYDSGCTETTKEETMKRIDEVTNVELANEPDRWGYGDLAQELDRVEGVITRLGTTGADLTDWITRSRIVEQEMETRELDPRRDD